MRWNSPWARAVAAGLTAATLLVGTSPRLHAQDKPNDPHETPEVRKLTWRGVDHVDTHDLEKSIATRASECRSLIIQVFCWFSHSPTIVDKHHLNHLELTRDVTRIRVYYWKRGYRDTQVDTVVQRTGENQVKVEFHVTEGEPTRVRRLSISYDSTLISEKQRNRLTLLHANDPLDLITLDSMRVLFQNEMWDRGFGDAVVDTTIRVDTVTSRADVSLRLIKNRRTTVGPIMITGNKHVDPITIANSIQFHTGDLYRYSDVLESQRNLYESNLFRQATINVPLQRDTVKAVEINVIEAPLHETRVGGGLTNIDFAQLEARYTAYNLFGGARRLDISGTAGNLFASSLQGRGFFRNLQSDIPDSSVSPYLKPTWSAGIDFRQPAFLHRPPNAAGFGVFAHRQANPGVFIDNGYGGTMTFTRILSPRAPVSATYRYEVNRVQASDVYFCVNYGVCDLPTIASLRAHQSLSPLGLTGFVDRSDLPFSPTKGYVARVDLEHASALTLSDYRYNRAFLDAAFYTHQSGKKSVFSAHLRVGLVRALAGGQAGSGIEVLHPRKRFYAGGAQSVRGYTENQLGPRILTIDDSVLLEKHATTATGAPCDVSSVVTVTLCDPNTGDLGDGDFIPQPLGGTSLLEGSVEFRTPLPFFRGKFYGAVFVDGGLVGQSSLQTLTDLSSLAKGTGAVTPGFGVRYESPVGPIRVDFGINPKVSEQLSVVTSVVQNGRRAIVPLNTTRHFSVAGHTLLDRLTLHFSIGQAY